MIQFFQPRRGPQLEASLQHRVEDINPVLARVNHNPLFGYGPRTFAPDELRTSHLLDNPDNLTLDNAYLGGLAEGGVLGALALLTLLMTAYVSGWRAYRWAPDRDAKLVRLGLVLVVQNWILMGFVADIYGFNAPPKIFFALLAALAVARTESGWDLAAHYPTADDRHLLPQM
jgi:O-antigen ligase